MTRRGAYAPITVSGVIVISGALASCYVALLDYSPIDQHAAAHALFATHRLMCSFNFAPCEKETYTDGLSDWTYRIIGLVLKLNEQSVPVQVAATVAAVPLFVAPYMLEKMLHAPWTIGLLILGYVFFKKSKISMIQVKAA